MMKWEEEYNKFKNGDRDKEIIELQDKFSNKTINKEEYDILQKYLKVKSNLDKVKNILEYKKKLKNQLNKIKQEKDKRALFSKSEQEKEKLNKRKEMLESQLKLYESRLEGINKALKEKGLTKERKEELEKSKKECIMEIDNNNSLYVVNMQEIKKLDDQKTEDKNKLSDIPDEVLEKKSMEISTKISKCNMISSNLMKGASWDSIELKLDNWKDRKFTRKVDEKNILDYKKEEKLTEEKLTEEKLTEEKLTEEKPTEEKPTEEKPTEEKPTEEKPTEENKTEESKNKFMMVLSGFAMKHPRLAKLGRSIRDGFVGLVQRIKDAGNEEEIIEEEKPAEEKPEQVNEEKTSIDNNFKKYIKDIAENGLKQADQNRLREFRDSRNKSQENSKDER